MARSKQYVRSKKVPKEKQPVFHSLRRSERIKLRLLEIENKEKTRKKDTFPISPKEQATYGESCSNGNKTDGGYNNPATKQEEPPSLVARMIANMKLEPCKICTEFPDRPFHHNHSMDYLLFSGSNNPIPPRLTHNLNNNFTGSFMKPFQSRDHTAPLQSFPAKTSQSINTSSCSTALLNDPLEFSKQTTLAQLAMTSPTTPSRLLQNTLVLPNLKKRIDSRFSSSSMQTVSCHPSSHPLTTDNLPNATKTPSKCLVSKSSNDVQKKGFVCEECYLPFKYPYQLTLHAAKGHASRHAHYGRKTTVHQFGLQSQVPQFNQSKNCLQTNSSPPPLNPTILKSKFSRDCVSKAPNDFSKKRFCCPECFKPFKFPYQLDLHTTKEHIDSESQKQQLHPS